MNNRVNLKVVLIGGQNVGKTALMERFINERFTARVHQTTIGAAFAAKEIKTKNKKLVVGVWDTAGTEKYKAMIRMFYRDAKAAVLCYDITEKITWLEMKEWLLELRKNEENCKVYICGTKKDLVENNYKYEEVNYETASEYAKGIGAKLILTSSKTGENVDELFQIIVDDYVDTSKLNKMQETVNLTDSLNVTAKRKCCKIS